ncbi:putative bifunctional diguanylate cyclase/phosphodiesterase [Methyloceanibacter sp.]|uniref:putative bifunctional diguanylate cyclase/phosphodiesterase n=1 Tax=Methyloceanibacter sp. TaxID=1965321 RepID=UPI002D67C919|nr:EAL domain-containing protein [Methyloceanibacter sp.]HZP10141.1 EAL domain-containing protein [Methyloceanibacter sp.]
MAEVGARDRLVMTGLVVLGLVTVIAGVLSGYSTIDYVLGRDAQEAALSWAAKVNTALASPNAPDRVLDQNFEVLDAHALVNPAGNPGLLPANRGFQPGFSVVEMFDRLTGGWALGGNGQSRDDFVSKLDGFAILDAGGKPLATAGNLSASKLDTLLARDDVQKALTSSKQADAVAIASRDRAGDARVAFVPVTQDGKVARIYAFSLDQSAAAALTNVALTVATLMASLFIVLGFSVPAAIASRRIRERWLAEDKIRHLALHDSLTGLPNRLQFHQHLERAVSRAKRHGQLVAVFGLDLDRFKDVNDTMGHATGDALLAEVAARLKENVRESDLVGRLGGDEFAIVAEDIAAPEDAMRLARRVCTALGEPYRVNGHELATSVSIGIAIGPVEGEPADGLLKNADLALYRAKEDGRNTFRFFEPAMDAALQKRRRLEADLRAALRKNQLYLDYQPQFDLETGKLTGYEALVRWWHPSQGEIPPATFIPIAEETGLIVTLGEWILRTACSYATTWPLDTKLAVNLSPAQFKTQDVYNLVRRILNETGLEPERLELEITEGIILQNTEAVLDTLQRLDQLGVSIAMDDFGTGYSSLSYLTRFPVKKIKIDRSFIDTLGTSPQTSAIVSSIVGLGQSLHVTITAEGVETESQAAMLKKWGCDQVQGFYYGKPDPEVPESAANAKERPLVA